MSAFIKGHSCEGLQAFEQAASYGCIPRIDESGIVRGCDDHNPIAITNCPFCGVLLEG